jgi:hypothetical protein
MRNYIATAIVTKRGLSIEQIFALHNHWPSESTGRNRLLWPSARPLVRRQRRSCIFRRCHWIWCANDLVNRPRPSTQPASKQPVWLDVIDGSDYERAERGLLTRVVRDWCLELQALALLKRQGITVHCEFVALSWPADCALVFRDYLSAVRPVRSVGAAYWSWTRTRRSLTSTLWRASQSIEKRSKSKNSSQKVCAPLPTYLLLLLLLLFYFYFYFIFLVCC